MFFAAKHQATCLNLTLFLLAVVTNRSQVATGASPHCGMLEPEASNTRTPFCCMIAHIVWLCHALSSASVGMHASGMENCTWAAQMQNAELTGDLRTTQQ